MSEQTRLIAWSAELRAAHGKLRAALQITRDALQDGESAESLTRDLQLFCRGFCTALADHHQGEDRQLFPAIAAAHPELADTLRKLTQDHSMIDHLLGDLQAAVDHGATPATLDQHLDGVAAIMESHFGYEERQLLTVLETLALDADPAEVLGSL